MTITVTHAQSDSVSAPKTMPRVDSIGNKVNSRIDAVQLKINALLNPDINKLFKKRKKRDSLQSDSLKNINARDQRHKDSIAMIRKDRINQMKNGQVISNKFPSSIDSINSTNPAKQFKKKEYKINEFQKNVTQPADQLRNTANDKLSMINKEGGDGTNLPKSLPTSSTNSKIEIKTPQLLNSEIKIDLPLQNKLSEDTPIQDKMGGIKDFPKEQIDKLNAIDGVKDVQNKLGSVNKITDKVQSYQADAKEIVQGNLNEVKELPKTLEQQVTNVNELQGLKKETSQFEQYKEIGEKIKEPEALKEEAMKQSTTVAINHFAGKQQVLQGAIDNMSKLKNKYASLSNLKDIPKRKRNEMKGKPFIERIVPGITFQIQKKGNVILDYNPLIGFRFTPRFTVGAGWNERITIGNRLKISLDDRIYGPRIFADVKIGKGFSVRTDIEKMNTYVPSLTSNGYSISEEYRAWVWSAFVGIKKEYNFVKKTKGTFQIMYNLYDDHNNSPYSEKLNVRFGFDFPMNKNPQTNPSH